MILHEKYHLPEDYFFYKTSDALHLGKVHGHVVLGYIQGLFNP